MNLVLIQSLLLWFFSRPNKRYIDESSGEEELVPVSNKKKKSMSNQPLPQPPEFIFMSGLVIFSY